MSRFQILLAKRRKLKVSSCIRGVGQEGGLGLSLVVVACAARAWELGMISLISLANCFSLLDGVRDVVIKICGHEDRRRVGQGPRPCASAWAAAVFPGEASVPVGTVSEASHAGGGAPGRSPPPTVRHETGCRAGERAATDLGVDLARARVLVVDVRCQLCALCRREAGQDRPAHATRRALWRRNRAPSPPSFGLLPQAQT